MFHVVFKTHLSLLKINRASISNAFLCQLNVILSYLIQLKLILSSHFESRHLVVIEVLLFHTYSSIFIECSLSNRIFYKHMTYSNVPSTEIPAVFVFSLVLKQQHSTASQELDIGYGVLYYRHSNQMNAKSNIQKMHKFDSS